MSNLLGGEQSMLEKLMAAQERIAELEANARSLRTQLTIAVTANQQYVQSLAELEADNARLRVDAGELWRALNDLSFECCGGIGLTTPTVDTYNRTFTVMDAMRGKYAAKESA